ncbi:MBL fold metallo-hydrolase [Syntrophomonas palmitatica]|uniref:MBL fold metallo-hydrolase n=1 Tax=Syntrophomonas palmitatica TaxID=402877 RepID=UPI0006D04780|nr:MBL fold metallo-hydrolase [Syntrophomonas palmitatica]
MPKESFQVTFWGVRGSLPVPGAETIRFGGNTSCVQVQIGEQLIIFDGGTGIYKLGQQLVKNPAPVKGDIFITHTHWDHIQGFPFFSPAFIPGNRFTLYGPAKTDNTFAELMKGQMVYQHFPVSLDSMGAGIDFCELDSGEDLDLGNGVRIRTVHNNHPNGGISYRVDHEGRSVCYVTDTEHYEYIDPDIKSFISQADLVIYDTHFTDDEYHGYEGYPTKKGWGHSTWQEGIKLIEAAEAKKLVLFHHANFHNDKDMETIEKDARKRYSDCVAAREGMVIAL